MTSRDHLRLIYGTSQKVDGQMILRFGKEAEENRKKFFSGLGINIGNTVSANLVHGNNIEVVSQSMKGQDIRATDGLITNELEICLTITVSDCLPVFFYDPKKQVVGIAHAGWRGTLAGITRKMIEKMEEIFSSDSRDIKVYIGPHIQKCHFEITSELLPDFDKHQKFISLADGRIFVDLAGIVQEELISVGVDRNNIEVSPVCTYCNKDYFSYRRDKPGEVRSQVAYICLD